MKARHFTIADVATFSGLKAHTLRVWERRYDLFTPERSVSNVRYYNIKQLEVILKLSVLNQAGFKISRLIAMQIDEIEHNLQNLKTEDDRRHRALSKLIISIFRIDTDEFDSTLDDCIGEWGYNKTFSHAIIPLMERLQLYTCKRSELEFDFAIAAIRRKMFGGIETVSPSAKIPRSALLFLPQGEYFDLVLLYYFYLLKSTGLNVLYMGSNVSFEKLKQVVEMKSPDFLITYLSPQHARRAEDINQFADIHLQKGLLLAAGFDHLNGKEEHRMNVKFLHYKKVPAFLFQ
jgi:MerR family transcriptional regulator, light-induced transcriptional regulator